MSGCRGLLQIEIPTWMVAEYPLAVLPVGVTSSEDRLSEKIPSDRLEIGFVPLDAYAPLR